MTVAEANEKVFLFVFSEELLNVCRRFFIFFFISCTVKRYRLSFNGRHADRIKLSNCPSNRFSAGPLEAEFYFSKLNKHLDNLVGPQAQSMRCNNSRGRIRPVGCLQSRVAHGNRSFANIWHPSRFQIAF